MATLTSVDVKSSGGDYTSLSAAEAGEAKDLVAADEQLTINLFALADTTNVAFAGSWVCDATRYIHVTTDASARHAGIWDNNKYRITSSGTDVIVITDADFTIIEGLLVEVSSASAYRDGIVVNASSCVVRKNIVKSTSANANAIGVYLNSTTCQAYNNIVYDFNGTDNWGLSGSGGDGNSEFYYNTVYNCIVGIFTDYHDSLAKNNAVFLNTDDFSGTFDTGDITHNASDDGDGTSSQTLDASGTPAYATEFTDQSLEDVTPTDIDSILVGNATDLSGLGITDDILGNARDGSTPDIGAFEFQTGGTPAQEQQIIWFSKGINLPSIVIGSLVGLLVKNPKLTKRELFNPSKWIGLIIFIVILAKVSFAFAGASDIGDVGVYPKPTAPTLPAAGGKYIDPTFGTEVLRVTDRDDEDINVHNYSQYSPFNSDSTRFFITDTLGSDGNAALYSFDPVGFTCSKIGLLFSTPLLRFASACWSYSDPDVMYSFKQYSQMLYKFEPDTKTYTLIKDFSGVLPSGDLRYLTMSTDDRWFSFIVGNPDNNDGVLAAYDKQTDTTYQYDFFANYTVDNLHVATISQDGTYVYTQPSGTLSDKYLWNITAGTVEVMQMNETVRANGHHDMGGQSYFHIDTTYTGGAIIKRDYDDAQNWTHIFQSPGEDWTQEVHISLNHSGDDFIFPTFGFPSVQTITKPYQDEIFQVFTDGSSMQNTRRLVHHRSVSIDYLGQPQAASSRDGRFVMYKSNWDNSAYIDVFIVKVPTDDVISSPSVMSGTMQ